jgi:exosortase
MNQFSQLAVIGKRTLARPQWRALSWKVPVTIALLAWLYSSILFHLALQWRNDSNFSHGFLVPAFALFVLWRNKLHLQSIPVKPSSWGLLVVAFSLLVLVIGVLGAELFLARISLLFVIAGLVLTFLGVDHLRATLFALSCLLLMIPIPAIVFNEITFPLQILSSQIASAMLPWFGVPVLCEGNIINLAAMSLEISEACSGIRSLLSLITLAVIYGYMVSSLKWVRIALVAAAVPIAVLANSFRIVVTGLLVQYWNPRKAEGVFHAFSGWLVFLVSVAMLFLVQQILTRPRYRRTHVQG